MTPERYEQIGRLFHAALELEPGEWAGFLRQACAGDEELRRKVASLLALDERAKDFIEQSAWEVVVSDEEETRFCPRCQRSYPSQERYCTKDNQPLSLPDPYQLLGRTLADKYQIEALVGVGGVGAVYSARHLGLDRRVAFKILQPNVALGNRR